MIDKKEILEKSERILEQIRPHLRKDDGDVRVVDYEEDTHTLVVAYLGSCVECPLSIMTLRAGIEKLILKNIPQIRRVELD